MKRITAIGQTEMEKSQVVLKARVKEMEEILNSITDGFFTLDKHLHFTYINSAFERICNCRKEDFIGTHYCEQFPKAVNLKFYREYSRAVKEHVNVQFEEYSPTFDKWFSVKAYPSVHGLSVYFTDITPQVKDRKLVEAQNVKLNEISWILSHELRAPLASILGLAPLLNYEDPTNPDNKKMIDWIIDSCRQLDTVIKQVDEKAKSIKQLAGR